MATTSAGSESFRKRADPGSRKGVGKDSKRPTDESEASANALKRALKLAIKGGGGARDRKPLSGVSVLHDVRRAVDLAEKSVRVIGSPDVLAQTPQLQKEWNDIVHTVNKIGRRFRLPLIASLPRQAPRKAIGTSTAATITSSRVEPTLGSNNEMIHSGLLRDSQAFQELMGWSTRQALSKAIQSNRVFYLTHKSGRYFPAFYGDSAYERSHLETVSKILGDLPGGSKLQFFLTPKRSLDGQTPLQALAAGRLSKVKDVASAFAEVPVSRS